jgi:hypothetical protein
MTIEIITPPMPRHGHDADDARRNRSEVAMLDLHDLDDESFASFSMHVGTCDLGHLDPDLDSDDESFMSFLGHMGMGGRVRRRRRAMKSADGHDGDGGDRSPPSVPSDDALAARRRGACAARAGHLFSASLFVLGSALYLGMAVWECQWARMVQPWPEDVLDRSYGSGSDDIVYNNYRLELLYYGTPEAVEEASSGVDYDDDDDAPPPNGTVVIGTTPPAAVDPGAADDEAASFAPSAAYPTLSPVPFDPTAAVAAGYYDNYAWDELPPQVQGAFATLGYDKDLWDDPLGIGLKASSQGSKWATLTPEQQQAAALVGYDQQSWDASVESDAYDILDDDTLFYIHGKSGWWVGRYTVVYFSASFCFVLSGLADFFREKHFLNIFFFLGGVFGCISAIYTSNNDFAYFLFDVISVHMFLLEAIKMFYEEESLGDDAARWMKRSLMLANIEFLLGATLDVCVRPHICFSESRTFCNVELIDSLGLLIFFSAARSDVVCLVVLRVGRLEHAH